MPLALLSLSDKTGLLPFAEALRDRGWTLLSTGGTARALREARVEVTEVSELTGHPEMMDGRVKTLHPAIHAGILARRGHPDDLRELEALGYAPIDLVAVNLYPFEATASRRGVSDSEAIEQIDIGGPAMLRSAAKNHESVWVVVDPAGYPRVLDALDRPSTETLPLRRELAARVYRHTSAYDASIAAFLSGVDEEGRRIDGSAEAGDGVEPASSREEGFPARIVLSLEKDQELRYGENPGQRAALYRVRSPGERAEERMRQLQGKELSFNNLLDVDAGLLAVSMWTEERVAACAILKHTTPCGIAIGDDAADAYRKALATDPASAFGSVVAFSVELSEESAERIKPHFVEVVVAPSFSAGAVRLLREKRNLRLLQSAVAGDDQALDFKRVRGGFLVQDRLSGRLPETEWRVATRREPTPAEWEELRFAWRAVATVKSNAILLARGGMAIGIGAGQTSRVDASRLAVLKAGDNGHDLRGAVLASDAFFPFRDGVDAAAAAGVLAVVQPGGSVRDDEVIAAADEHGMAMVFTGRRLFRH